MKTKYTILAYIISFLVIVIAVFLYNKEHLPVAIVAFGGALVIQQGIKMLFREHIKKDKFKSRVDTTISDLPDEPIYGDDESNDPDETVGRPDADGY